MNFNIFLNPENLSLLFTLYIILSAIVVIASVYLSKYVDALDKKTNLSGAFIGGVILAAVTSLPELFTSITAVCILNQSELVQGNVYGSNIFNFTIIAVCVLIAAKAFRNAEISETHNKTLIFTIIMFILSLIGIYIPENYTIPIIITRINIISILIILLYIINLKTVKNDDVSADDEKNTLSLTVKQITIRFILFAVILVIISILLTQVTNSLSERLALGKTVAGAIFLGIATSLPELASSINLVRLKNFNASIGNITGSNLFNFTVLCLGDLLYKKGSIYNTYGDAVDFTAVTKANTGSIVLIIFGIISSILSIIILKLKKKTSISIILALAILASYVSSIVFSI